MAETNNIFVLCQDHRSTTPSTQHDKLLKIDIDTLSSISVDLQKAYNNDPDGNIILTSSKPFKLQAPTGNNDELFVISDRNDTIDFFNLTSVSSTGSKLSAMGGQANAVNSLSVGYLSSVSATSNNSFALGTNSNVDASNSFMFNDGNTAYENTRDSSIALKFANGLEMTTGTVKRGTVNTSTNFRIEQASVNTITSTIITLWTYTIPSNSVLGIEARVLGVRTGGVNGNVGDRTYTIVTATAWYNGTSTTVNSANTYLFEVPTDIAVTIVASGSDTIIVTVKGETNTNFSWIGTMFIQEFKYA